MALATVLLFACNMQKPVVEYEGVYSEYALFVDSLFGIVNGERQLIPMEEGTCMQLDSVMDFNGDGISDVLVTHVQACGGNAIGNAFFFVTYSRDGHFVRTNTFGTSVFDDPVVQPWEGMPSVLITNESFDADSEEVEETVERYVLVDTFALRAVSATEIEPLASVIEEAEGDYCSWYCGGEVKEITASSSPKDGEADNAHDFDYTTLWMPAGNGIGESLVYKFSGSCPRITTVKVLNGDVQSEDLWMQSARVRLMRMYVNDQPYALLAFEDSPTLQCFDIGVVGFHDPNAPDWTLTFEVLEVYPGTRGGLAIAELTFDGIDVH